MPGSLLLTLVREVVNDVEGLQDLMAGRLSSCASLV